MIFFFKDTPATEIYTLSLHDALPISYRSTTGRYARQGPMASRYCFAMTRAICATWPRSWTVQVARSCRRVTGPRSEEHTTELQSRQYLACCLLLEKKKNKKSYNIPYV